MSWLRQKLRSFTPDAIALEVSGIPTSAIRHLLLEPYVLNYSRWQSGMVISLYFVLRLVQARPIGQLKDAIETRLGGKTPSLWQRWLAASVALTAYQIPLYCFFALLTGVSLEQLAKMLTLLGGLNFVFGEGYEYCLRSFRRWPWLAAKLTAAPQEPS